MFYAVMLNASGKAKTLAPVKASFDVLALICRTATTLFITQCSVWGVFICGIQLLLAIQQLPGSQSGSRQNREQKLRLRFLRQQIYPGKSYLRTTTKCSYQQIYVMKREKLGPIIEVFLSVIRMPVIERNSEAKQIQCFDLIHLGHQILRHTNQFTTQSHAAKCNSHTLHVSHYEGHNTVEVCKI